MIIHNLIIICFRVFATTMSVFFSRVGTIFGNVVFTYLIDENCVILIACVLLQLFGKLYLK